MSVQNRFENRLKQIEDGKKSMKFNEHNGSGMKRDFRTIYPGVCPNRLECGFLR
jgi:hypothetical protein